MDALDLQSLNLIVGKNATGKSRVLIVPTAQTHAFKFGQIHPDSFLDNDRVEEKLITVEDVPALIEELDECSEGFV